MKCWFLSIPFIAFCSTLAFSEPLPALSDSLADSLADSREFVSQTFHDLSQGSFQTAFSDSTLPRPKLLPDNLSLMERGLWGESGFLRTIGLSSPLTAESRKSELSLRRTMLTAHQVGGFVTFGLMVSACYFGQRTLDGNRNLSTTHSTLVKFTIGTYFATALLSILSPPPLLRRNEGGTTSIHKFLAWIHFAGMILTPIIGGLVWKTHRVPGSAGVVTQNDSAARFHQISAYATTAVFGAAMIVMTF